MHFKVNVFPIRLVDRKYPVIFAFICDSELAIDVLQFQNIGDGSFIKPYLTIPFYVRFSGSINDYYIYPNYHGLICCTNSCYKLLVAEEVNCVLIVNQDNTSEI